MAKNNNEIKIRTNGNEVRQFLHVSDCIKCFNFIMNNFYDITEQYLDISNFQWDSILTITQIISSYYKCDIEIGSEIDNVQRNINLELQLNILKYWQPKISLESGINLLINYYEKNS